MPIDSRSTDSRATDFGPNDFGSAPARLQMRDVSKAFGATRALANVSLDVHSGEVHALIGENGAGKSTLMKILAGAIVPDQGEIRLDGHLYRPADPRSGRAAGVAMIYQELSLAPHLSVMENILLGNEPTRGPVIRWSALAQLARVALAQVGRGDLDPTVRVSRLSLADRQLVEVARSIAVGCRILVLDEPTSSVTARDVEHVFNLIRRLREQGLAVVYISHFLEEVQQISDRFTVLRDGRTVGTGTTRDSSHAEIVALMVGREVTDLYPRSRRIPGDTLLSVDHLAGIPLPRDASLELRRGEVLGVAGLVGSGRTELLRALFGLAAVRQGRIRIGQFSQQASGSRWDQGVGLVSEDRKSEGLALKQSIADNLTLPRLRGLGPCGLVLPQRVQLASQRWIARLGVKCHGSTQPVGELSGGNQQKVALARLLHADVDVWLLDEPTRGIDVGSKAQLYQLIDELVSANSTSQRSPKAVLMVSSYLPELLGVCDRIAVMSRGMLLPARPVGERNEHEIMLEATGTRTEL